MLYRDCICSSKNKVLLLHMRHQLNHIESLEALRALLRVVLFFDLRLREGRVLTARSTLRAPEVIIANLVNYTMLYKQFHRPEHSIANGTHFQLFGDGIRILGNGLRRLALWFCGCCSERLVVATGIGGRTATSLTTRRSAPRGCSAPLKVARLQQFAKLSLLARDTGILLAAVVRIVITVLEARVYSAFRALVPGDVVHLIFASLMLALRRLLTPLIIILLPLALARVHVIVPQLVGRHGVGSAQFIHS